VDSSQGLEEGEELVVGQNFRVGIDVVLIGGKYIEGEFLGLLEELGMTVRGSSKEMEGFVAPEKDSTIEIPAKDGKEAFRRGSSDPGIY